MNKKIITIIWLLIPIFIFMGCTGGGFKTRSCTELTNEDMEEIQKLEITEDYKAVRIYETPVMLLATVAVYKSFDKMVSETNQDRTYLLIFNKDKKLINKNEKATYWEELYNAIFEPEIYLDDIIKGNYTIKRILCNHRYNTSSPEQVIYYDTTKGMYVFLHIPDNNEPDVSYLIPWDVVEEKAEEAMDFYEENDDLYGYTPFWDAEKYFSDYKLDQ